MLTPPNELKHVEFPLSVVEAKECIASYVSENVTEADMEDVEGFVSWAATKANDFLGETGLDCDSMVVVWNAMSLA